MARIIGIDLGAHTVKIAVMDGSFGRFQLQDYRLRAVPQDAETLGDLDARVTVLSELIAELPAAKGETITSAAFPAEQASVRMVRLPFGDRSQVEKTLWGEVENVVPFDLEDMAVASRILQVQAGDSRVLTAMVSKDRLGPLLARLAEAGIDPKAMMLDADTIGEYASSGVEAVIDLGHSRTLVALCRDGHTVGARAISMGGRDLTLALCEELQIEWGEAEGRKHAAHVGPGELPSATVEWEDDEHTDVSGRDITQAIPVGGRDKAVLEAALAPLLASLRASLIAFEDTHEAEIDALILTGGGASLGGLRSWFEAELGVPVRTAQISDQAEDLGDPGRFALVHRIALGVAGGKGRALDVRTGAFAWRGNIATLGNLLRYGALAAAFFMVAGMGFFGYRYVSLSAELSGLETELAESVLAAFPDVDPDKVDDPSMAMAIMQEKTLAVTTRVDSLGSIIAPEPPVTGMVKEVSTSVPPHNVAPIDVTELVVTDTAVTLKAMTTGFEAATTILSSLQSNPKFKNAQKGDEKKKGETVRFTITIPLDEESAEEEG